VSKRSFYSHAVRSARRAGFTMIEVMMGLAILAVGAAAVIALLKFTLLGTLDGRHVANASLVTSSYIERMRTASIAWTNVDNLDVVNMDGTAPNSPVPGFGTAAAAAMATPGIPGPWIYFGGTADNARATLDGTQAAAGGANDIFRVELRTLWARSGRSIGADCNAAPATFTTLLASPANTAAIAGATRRRSEYGVVYLTTFIRRSN
jgi:prepilin-type N-terminal cleavage/methylation domain-containing protein